MRIKLLLSGKTTPEYLQEGLAIYEKRIGYYAPFEIVFLPEPRLSKSMTVPQMKAAESDIFAKVLRENDYLVLLDEKGKQFSSVSFSSFLADFQQSGKGQLLFAIGSAHGFDERLKKRANLLISLSPLTFPHQLARLIFAEQLYRAFTIIKKEPYHHS